MADADGGAAQAPAPAAGEEGGKNPDSVLVAIFKDWDKIKDDPEWHKRELAALMQRKNAVELGQEAAHAAQEQAVYASGHFTSSAVGSMGSAIAKCAIARDLDSSATAMDV